MLRLPVLLCLALGLAGGLSRAQEVKDGLIHLEAKPELIELVPSFAVMSLQRSADFYVNKLGFTVVLQSGNYGAVGRDTVQIGLVQDKNAMRGYKPSSYIRMVRIDDYYKQLKDRGVKMTTELVTRPSKMREFSVTDPDGFILVFGEYTGG
ncbi:MAG: VOC family protein [Terrimicrobiaceae bacterium]